MSLLDLVGVAAVLPIMMVLTGTDLEDGLLGGLHRLMGSPNRSTFVIMLAGGMILAFVVKVLLAMVIQWVTSGFINRLYLRTSSRLLGRFLAEDYLTHKRRNTAELTRALNSAVADAHLKVLSGVTNVASQVLSIVLLMVFLLLAMPVPTLVALAYFGVTVFVLNRTLGERNRIAGRDAMDASFWTSKTIIDSMGGFREIRMHDAAAMFLARFDRHNKRLADASRRAGLLASIPKQVLELITISGLAVLLISITLVNDHPEELMPQLTLFVAVAIRMMPTIVGLLATVGTINLGREGLRITLEVLAQDIKEADKEAATAAAPSALLPVAVTDVSFRYPDASKNVLDAVSLAIPPGTSLALVGASGSGKTTLVDIMLGLLPPTRGTVSYGGTPIAEIGAAWRSVVSYVPQDVFILDDTLAANVALGIEDDRIDESLVLAALMQAQLSDLLAELPDGIHTPIGERGSRLSGGQRQRLGIARALYRQPKIIFLDEATSALDNLTEAQITRTIADLHGSVTTVVVAHRLSTVRHVDMLLFLEQGRVAASGTFEEVKRASPAFARLVELGRLDTNPGLGH